MLFLYGFKFTLVFTSEKTFEFDIKWNLQNSVNFKVWQVSAVEDIREFFSLVFKMDILLPQSIVRRSLESVAW